MYTLGTLEKRVNTNTKIIKRKHEQGTHHHTCHFLNLLAFALVLFLFFLPLCGKPCGPGPRYLFLRGVDTGVAALEVRRHGCCRSCRFRRRRCCCCCCCYCCCYCCCSRFSGKSSYLQYTTYLVKVEFRRLDFIPTTAWCNIYVHLVKITCSCVGENGKCDQLKSYWN